MPLKICPLVLLLFLVKVGHHIGHLNVGKLGVQVFRIYLFLKNVQKATVNIFELVIHQGISNNNSQANQNNRKINSNNK